MGGFLRRGVLDLSSGRYSSIDLTGGGDRFRARCIVMRVYAFGRGMLTADERGVMLFLARVLVLMLFVMLLVSCGDSCAELKQKGIETGQVQAGYIEKECYRHGY